LFQNQTVIVTGGAKGIGAGIVEAFLTEGANVVVADIAKDQLSTETSKKHPIFIETDVSNEESVISLFTQVIKQFGGVDILINNAGISAFTNFFEMSVSEWDKVLNTNLRSVFLCSRESAKIMKEGSAIVNISSTRANMSEPHTEAYAASKGGIISITHALAATLSERKIRVNSISPGWIETKYYDQLREIDHQQHFSGRVGKASDIAQCCLFLCSPNNQFITGTNITIDGGMTKKMIYEE